MNRNIIDAIGTLIKIQPTCLDDLHSPESFNYFAHYRNLEEYVKNLFANSFLAKTADDKRELWHKVFSHFGNATNPPDLMLRGGDAIEIKNIVLPEDEQYIYASMKSLTLNTVYPRQKLYADDPLVTKACRKAERWKEKDIIYAVGISWGNRLKQFCMVYGQDYCASPQHYEKILQDMRVRLKDFPNRSDFSHERSLGRVSNIDPLGATHLDLKNMWYIKSPWEFFRDVYRPNLKAEFNFMCIINEEKFSRLENAHKLFAWAEICPNLHVERILIRNPDEPEHNRAALLIRYEV